MMLDYQISRFTMVEPLPGYGLGLFNTLTRALGALPAEAWAEVTAGFDQDTAAELLEQGFLVAREVDEDLVLAHWRASMTYDQTTLTYLISPTRACNMACSYCIHGGRTRAEYMTLETARSVLDFIQADVEVKRPHTVRLDFGGAEAALNPSVIRYLAEGLDRLCRGRSLELKISLISNGLALKPELVQELITFGLHKVRITLSGPADIHDRLRPAKDGAPTYHRIMATLSSLAGQVEIGLQGQYETSNGDYRRFPELLDDLTARGLRDHLGEVSFGPVLPTGVSFESGLELLNGPLDCLAEEDTGRYLWLQDQIILKGFRCRSGPPLNRCLANYRNSMVIDLGGAMTGCPSLMDHPELEYGHVRTGVDFRREAAFLARVLPEKCRKNCHLAPLCDGGCRQQALVRTGSFDGINCLLATYDVLTRAYMRQALAGFN